MGFPKAFYELIKSVRLVHEYKELWFISQRVGQIMRLKQKQRIITGQGLLPIAGHSERSKESFGEIVLRMKEAVLITTRISRKILHSALLRSE